jgi:uncharacterized protein
MSYTTYSLRPEGVSHMVYARAVARLADDVIRQGESLRATVTDYGCFVASSAREARRTHEEYLLEALLLGVLWRARGHEALAVAHGHADVLGLLAGERRSGCGRRRDGSNAILLSLDAPHRSCTTEPSLEQIDRLTEWLLATGEYDDELARLRGWQDFLAGAPERAPGVLRALVGFAATFEAMGRGALGVFTARVDDFLQRVLPQRGVAEDTVQCSRPRVEYHFNMVGAEILNRAWRKAFLACERHVVVLPGCARRRMSIDCLAVRSETELRCRGCSVDCSVAAATHLANRSGDEALAVVHGSDFGRFLASPALSGGEVGIVGVACVPGLVGAGWRARAHGLPAQCVLLESSGCEHWRERPEPTRLDLAELGRILEPGSSREEASLQSLAI